ncbi:hypothetical protein L596_026920 [Steinernema carpocapsae]|uniref:Uncharacterized protein n=1 Tax=Steinernema carpocapsae TaxID=34508 RepID=A0A4U5M2V3_STECR|nr:hypothetical protein L596_026920 [Steinernema carpocapsae]
MAFLQLCSRDSNHSFQYLRLRACIKGCSTRSCNVVAHIPLFTELSSKAPRTDAFAAVSGIYEAFVFARIRCLSLAHI